MQKFIGTKILKATPMNKVEYCIYRGWEIPQDEDGGEDGFLVEYQDGGKANDNRHEGYISWSPKEAFDKAYRPMVGFTFGLAIESLRKNLKVQRAGWNGKGMFLFLVPGSTFKVSRAPLNTIYPEGTEINYCPHIDMKTADGKIVPWLASQTDVLAEDWQIVEQV